MIASPSNASADLTLNLPIRRSVHGVAGRPVVVPARGSEAGANAPAAPVHDAMTKLVETGIMSNLATNTGFRKQLITIPKDGRSVLVSAFVAEGNGLKDPANRTIAMVPILNKEHAPTGKYDMMVGFGTTLIPVNITLASIHGKLAVKTEEKAFLPLTISAHNLPGVPENRVSEGNHQGARSRVATAIPQATVHEDAVIVLPTVLGRDLRWTESAGKVSASGINATGWRGHIADGKGGWTPVFIKSVRDRDSLRRLQTAETTLRMLSRAHPKVAAVAPTSLVSFQIDGETKLPAGSNGLVIAPLQQGITVEGFMKGKAKDAAGAPVGPPSLNAVSALGSAVTQAIHDITSATTPGARVLLPDFTKPDNMIIPDGSIQAGTGLPRKVVFVDHDSLLVEGKGGPVACSPLYADVAHLNSAAGGDHFRRADDLHAYQVGRLVLRVALGDQLPPPISTPAMQEANLPEVYAYASKNWHHAAMRAFDKKFGDAPQAVELKRIIGRCCSDDLSERPRLEVLKQWLDAAIS